MPRKDNHCRYCGQEMDGYQCMPCLVPKLKAKIESITEEKYLLDEEKFGDFKKEALASYRLRLPVNYTERVLVKGAWVSYGALFEPHVDQGDGSKVWTIRFIAWRKDMVMFHRTTKGKLVIETPTLTPIEFNYRKQHGFIPKNEIKNLELGSEYWRKKASSYYGKFLFIAQFGQDAV